MITTTINGAITTVTMGEVDYENDQYKQDHQYPVFSWLGNNNWYKGK